MPSNQSTNQVSEFPGIQIPGNLKIRTSGGPDFQYSSEKFEVSRGPEESKVQINKILEHMKQVMFRMPSNQTTNQVSEFHENPDFQEF